MQSGTEVGPEFCLQDMLHDEVKEALRKGFGGREFWYE